MYVIFFVLKGVGKSHNDAASVRTNCPIPASCGLYYFEVKIVSKGRDGYMGIGLTASSASNFKMNRLPGKSSSAQKVLLSAYIVIFTQAGINNLMAIMEMMETHSVHQEMASLMVLPSQLVICRI